MNRLEDLFLTLVFLQLVICFVRCHRTFRDGFVCCAFINRRLWLWAYASCLEVRPVLQRQWIPTSKRRTVRHRTTIFAWGLFQWGPKLSVLEWRKSKIEKQIVSSETNRLSFKGFETYSPWPALREESDWGRCIIGKYLTPKLTVLNCTSVL